MYQDNQSTCCTGEDGKQVHDIDLSSLQIESSLLSSLFSLLKEYSQLFVRNDKDLGKTTMITHCIDTGDNSPIKQQPYRTAHKHRGVIEEEIEKMLEQGVIRPSQSPWASPVVLGGFRFCVDYRKLNSVTKNDSYPLPRIDDILGTLNDCSYFTTLDQASGYWQIPLAEADKEKTAFTTYRGLYEFNVIPFGLCNAPAYFQRLMNLLLSVLHWQICLVYLDDILIFSKTFEEHLTRIRLIFEKLLQAGIKIILPKARLHTLPTQYPLKELQ